MDVVLHTKITSDVTILDIHRWQNPTACTRGVTLCAHTLCDISYSAFTSRCVYRMVRFVLKYCGICTIICVWINCPTPCARKASEKKHRAYRVILCQILTLLSPWNEKSIVVLLIKHSESAQLSHADKWAKSTLFISSHVFVMAVCTKISRDKKKHTC